MSQKARKEFNLLLTVMLVLSLLAMGTPAETAQGESALASEDDTQWHTWGFEETDNTYKTWKIMFNKPLNKYTISGEAVFVTDQANENILVEIKYDENEPKELEVIPKEEYSRGNTYILWIRDLIAEDGASLNRNVKMFFTITGEEMDEEPDASFRDVDPEWLPSFIYEHELVSPRNICIGPGGDAFVYDTYKGVIYKVSHTNYAISEYLDLSEYTDANTSLMIGGMAWQPGAGRFLLGIHNQIWYYDPAADEVGLLSPGLPDQTHAWSHFEVNPADDSFFASTQTPTPDGDIYRFYADMTAELIVSGTHGVYQTAYVSSENALYYTETFPGTLKKVNLETFEVTPVMGNLGIPGTFEPISVALNPVSGLINVFSPPNGLKDVHGNKLFQGSAGAGMICWWDAAGAEGAMVMAQHAGANLVYFDLAARKTPALTPYVNAVFIARNETGEVLINAPHDNLDYDSQILKIDASGIEEYYHDSRADLRALMNDANGNIYAAWSDGRINIITEAGIDNALPWAEGITNVLDMAYNPFNNKVIVMRHSPPNTVELLHVDVDDPTSRNVMATLQDDSMLMHTVRVTCGDDGSVYIIVAKGSGAPAGTFNILRFDAQGNKTTIHQDIFSDNRAITIPDIVYAREIGKLLVSTIEDIRIYPISEGSHSILAVSNGAVDIFALTEDKVGRIIGIQSGRVFQFEKKE